jgi:hypothetical protein
MEVGMKNEWKHLNELRVTDRDLSGLMYSYKYAKKNKDIRASGGGCCDSNGRWTKLYLVEQLEIKEDESGHVLYRPVKRQAAGKSHQEFQTQFGTYVSDDQGEFGGTLVTPGGETRSGNFSYFFELKGNVYAIDSMAHMGVAHFVLYQFTDPDHCTCLYSVGGMTDYIENKDIAEDLYFAAMDVKRNKAFILLSGYITKKDESKQWWGEIRLLKVEDDKAEEIVRLAGYNPEQIRNILVQDQMLYISCDKMVIRYDMQGKTFTYLTCLSEEDEKDLLETEEA